MGRGRRSFPRHVQVAEGVADVGATVHDVAPRAVGNEGNHLVVLGLGPNLLVEDEKQTGLSVHLLRGLVPRHPAGSQPLLPPIHTAEVLRRERQTRGLQREHKPPVFLRVSPGTTATGVRGWAGTGASGDLPVLAYANLVAVGGSIGRISHRCNSHVAGGPAPRRRQCVSTRADAALSGAVMVGPVWWGAGATLF